MKDKRNLPVFTISIVDCRMNWVIGKNAWPSRPSTVPVWQHFFENLQILIKNFVTKNFPIFFWNFLGICFKFWLLYERAEAFSHYWWAIDCPNSLRNPFFVIISVKIMQVIWSIGLISSIYQYLYPSNVGWRAFFRLRWLICRPSFFILWYLAKNRFTVNENSQSKIPTKVAKDIPSIRPAAPPISEKS